MPSDYGLHNLQLMVSEYHKHITTVKIKYQWLMLQKVWQVQLLFQDFMHHMLIQLRHFVKQEQI